MKKRLPVPFLSLEFQQSLDDTYCASIQNTCDSEPPATVRAYQRVYGLAPDGWPPSDED